MKLRTRETFNTKLHKVYIFLWDGMYDKFPLWEKYNLFCIFLEDVIERPTLWLLCKIYGHEPTMDHCMKPSHDLCLWCRKPMPSQAPRFRA